MESVSRCRIAEEEFAWLFPHIYANRPDRNYDPAQDKTTISWDVNVKCGAPMASTCIDGNLKSVEYADRLATIKVPTLIVVGEVDECDPSLSRDMHARITSSKLVILPASGHMTFVDQRALFMKTVDEFLRPPPK